MSVIKRYCDVLSRYQFLVGRSAGSVGENASGKSAIGKVSAIRHNKSKKKRLSIAQLEPSSPGTDLFYAAGGQKINFKWLALFST